jgi:hypothetical protein
MNRSPQAEMITFAGELSIQGRPSPSHHGKEGLPQSNPLLQFGFVLPESCFQAIERV